MVVRYHSEGVYAAMANVKVETDAESVRLLADDGKTRTEIALIAVAQGSSLPQASSDEHISAPEREKTKGDAPPSDDPDRTDTPADTPQHADRVTITGYVGYVPEIRTPTWGRKVLKFGLAEHRGEQTVWHDVLFFDEKAEKVARSIVKGEMGYSGRLSART